MKKHILLVSWYLLMFLPAFDLKGDIILSLVVMVWTLLAFRAEGVVHETDGDEAFGQYAWSALMAAIGALIVAVTTLLATNESALSALMAVAWFIILNVGYYAIIVRIKGYTEKVDRNDPVMKIFEWGFFVATAFPLGITTGGYLTQLIRGNIV